MKHLLLFFIFSGSLDGFSQVKELKRHDQKKRYDTVNVGSLIGIVSNDTLIKLFHRPPDDTPDTLRATLIVYFDNGPAILHTKPGFVVRQTGKDEIYLDDRKKVIKNLEVLTYKLKK